MTTKIITIFCISVALAGCEIFLPGTGGEGEKCGKKDACEEGLVCDFNKCVEPREEGEKCDSSKLESWYYTDEDDDDDFDRSMNTCEKDYCCISETCASEYGMVAHPDASYYWHPCPVGSEWNDCVCWNEMEKGELQDWDHHGILSQLCPPGFRLPQLNELLDLLGGCEDNISNNQQGYCDPCSESDACSSIFSHIDIGDSLWVYSSSYTIVDTTSEGNIDLIWVANLGTGELVVKEARESSLKATGLCIWPYSL